MDEKQIKELLEQVKSSVGDSESVKKLTTDLENLKNDAMTPDQFKEKMDAFAKDNNISGLKENTDKLAIELKKMQEAGGPVVKTLRDTITENLDSFKGLKDGSKKRFSLNNVKTDLIRSAVSGNTQGLRIPGVAEEARKSTVLANLFTAMTIGDNFNGTIKYYEDANLVRNADTIAEAGEYPESAIDWIERSLEVQKIGDTIPVSVEALDDIDFIESTIKKFLDVNVALKEDAQLWNGDGTPPNLKGVYTSATAFDASAVGKKVDASVYDLIRSIKTKISNGKQSKYLANYALMNPADVDIMQSKKNANYDYLVPPWVSRDGMNISGIQVIESSTVTAGTMLVGDFRHGEYWRRKAFDLTFGFIDDQFTHDLMTLKASKRAGLLVRLIDATAFYKVTDITASLAAMTS